MNKKTLYICGDSFCSTDPLYGPNWPELIADSCHNIQVVNLSIPGSSNYLIYLQVKRAIESNCDYLIYNATSSNRHEFVLNQSDFQLRDNIDRYWNLLKPDNNKDLLCNSWAGVSKHTKNTFSNKSHKDILYFFKHYIDLPVMIEKNYIFILHTLRYINQNLNSAQWAWSRGGFEHYSFKTVDQWDFTKWQKNHLNLNLWDYYDPALERPYYHVTDKEVLQSTCNQYVKMLNLTNI